MLQTTSVKKNILWNMLLTMSGYIFPLLTFPYVTRVLGATNLGLVNYALGIVDYAVLFSTLGMTMVGIRYISQCGNDDKRRSDVFSSLVTLHTLLSILALAIYLACIWFIPSLAIHKELYFVGAAKILFNVMLVEWLFQGLQDFRYVTLRTILTRLLYVIGVFVFVRSHDDYAAYFYVTIAQVIINALVNWRYAQRYINFRFRLQGTREFILPIFSMGVNSILLSFYTTFNVIYLGSTCGSESVGYYTTAIKLYAIILSVISSYNSVFVPHLNRLYAEGNLEQFKNIVAQSIHLVTLIALPIITIGICIPSQVVEAVAGKGYERSILPFSIVMVQILLVGIAQILENQILLAFKRFKAILVCTASSVVLSIIIIIGFVPTYAEVAAALAIAIPHIFEVVFLFYYVRKDIKIPINTHGLFACIFACTFIAAICFGVAKYITNSYIVVLSSSVFSLTTYFIILYYIFKDPLVRLQTNNILQQIVKHLPIRNQCPQY